MKARPTYVSSDDFPGVYMVRCTCNDKVYVGQSMYVFLRLNTHKSQLQNGVHEITSLQADWNLFGEGAFEFTVLRRVGNARRMSPEREKVEQGFIKSLQATDSRYGYNRELLPQYR